MTHLTYTQFTKEAGGLAGAALGAVAGGAASYFPQAQSGDGTVSKKRVLLGAALGGSIGGTLGNLQRNSRHLRAATQSMHSAARATTNQATKSVAQRGASKSVSPMGAGHAKRLADHKAFGTSLKNDLLKKNHSRGELMGLNIRMSYFMNEARQLKNIK